MKWAKFGGVWHCTDGVRQTLANPVDGKRSQPYKAACGSPVVGLLFTEPVDHEPRCPTCESTSKPTSG